MAASPHTAKLAAYSSASAHGGVAAADPHRLIVMLLDGALERIATARGCIARGDVGDKARLLNRVVSIIGELRASLNLQNGGSIAANLAELYDYMCRQILKANASNNPALLDEVCQLLHEIRGAWLAVPAQMRGK